jgi:hypothetical protein
MVYGGNINPYRKYGDRCNGNESSEGSYQKNLNEEQI